MKLHLASTESLNTVTAYGDGYVDVNQRRYRHPLLLTPRGAVQAWDVGNFDQLTADSFNAVLAAEPAVLLVGTGERQRFVHPRLLARLHAARIGVESMDTPAACRTYNILMAEGRQVAAALLLK